MPTTTLTPDQLDRQAARLHDTGAWQQIVAGWDITIPEPARPVSPDRAPLPPDRSTADWRDLLSVPVDQLIADSMRALSPAPPRERPLPGRLGAILPDRLHAWRRIGQPELRPSTHLAYARQILTEWGWQNTPYRLRNARGARCICGALLTAHRLGYGSLDTVDRAGCLAHRGAPLAGLDRSHRPLEPPPEPHRIGCPGPAGRHHPSRLVRRTLTPSAPPTAQRPPPAPGFRPPPHLCAHPLMRSP